MYMVMIDDDRVTENTKHKVKEESASAGQPLEREGNGRDKLDIGVKCGAKNTFSLQQQQLMMTALNKGIRVKCSAKLSRFILTTRSNCMLHQI